MKYKSGDKFVIEIETHYNHSGEKNSTRPLNDGDGADVSTLYRVRGFKSLVFDEEGLGKLEPIERDRGKAKWVWFSSTSDRTPCERRFACSRCCHEVITHDSEPWEKFCPECGSDMRKTQTDCAWK